MIRRAALALPSLLVALAGPGRRPGGLRPRPRHRPRSTPKTADGTLDTQAGSHPYAFTVHFELNTDAGGKTEGGEMRDIDHRPAAGADRQPHRGPRLPAPELRRRAPSCAADTQVGVLQAILPGVGEAIGPLYNLVPPPGVAAQLGFSAVGFTALLSASVQSEEGYAMRVDGHQPAAGSERGDGDDLGHPGRPRPRPRTRPRTGGAHLRRPAAALPHPADLLRARRSRSASQPTPNSPPASSSTKPRRLRRQGGNPRRSRGCEAVPFAPERPRRPHHRRRREPPRAWASS